MITERLMSAGEWEIELRPETPGDILDALTMFGWVIITPTWQPESSMSNANAFGMAIYSGVKYAHEGRRNLISGYGAASLLGMSGGLSDIINTTTEGTAVNSLVGLIRTMVLTHASDSINGITEGSLKTGTGNKTLIRKIGDSPLTLLRHIADRYAVEWRITPNRTLDCDNISAIWGTTPVAVLTPWWGGRQAGYAGFVADIELGEDVEEYANGVAVTADDGSDWEGDYHLTDTIYAPNGELVERIVYETDHNANDSTAAQEVVATRITQVQVVRREIRATLLDAHAPRLDIEPGDTLAVYAPDQDIWNSAATGINWRGQLIFPLSVRLYAMTWPVRQTMGVYFVDSTSALNKYDLTPYVVPEESDTRLDVGAPARALTAGSFRTGQFAR